MPIERILGTDIGKDAFYKTDRNFVGLEEQINNLDANKANKAWGNWITVTAENGWGTDAQYSKNDIGLVALKNSFTASGTIAKNTIIATLGSGYRPLTNELTIMAYNATKDIVLPINFTINIAGNIKIKDITNISANDSIRFNIVFPAA